VWFADFSRNFPIFVQNGGSVIYLHGGKPFIRGGDFTRRQQQGERPMQLNYSRAFGGKDLKMFGLSAVPDIRQVELHSEHRVMIHGSDGLWDFVSAEVACRIALQAQAAGRYVAFPLIIVSRYSFVSCDAGRQVRNLFILPWMS
jgi:protein phosphatase 2C family protein 2/3